MSVNQWYHYNQEFSTLDDLRIGLSLYKKISFHDKFNKPLENLYNYSHIDTLFFGLKFNQKIDNLPKNLKNLFLSRDFNQPLDNLPTTLKELKVLGCFNYPLDFLPMGLEKLYLGEKFNHTLDNLPSTIKELCFLYSGNMFDYPLRNLPKSIEYISLDGNYRYKDEVIKLYGNKVEFLDIIN